nr:hypothetical protein [Tanacetum cinerariifolium]
MILMLTDTTPTPRIIPKGNRVTARNPVMTPTLSAKFLRWKASPLSTMYPIPILKPSPSSLEISSSSSSGSSHLSSSSETSSKSSSTSDSPVSLSEIFHILLLILLIPHQGHCLVGVSSVQTMLHITIYISWTISKEMQVHCYFIPRSSSPIISFITNDGSIEESMEADTKGGTKTKAEGGTESEVEADIEPAVEADIEPDTPLAPPVSTVTKWLDEHEEVIQGNGNGMEMDIETVTRMEMEEETETGMVTKTMGVEIMERTREDLGKLPVSVLYMCFTSVTIHHDIKLGMSAVPFGIEPAPFSGYHIFSRPKYAVLISEPNCIPVPIPVPVLGSDNTVLNQDKHRLA